ncbi:hypothetical protein DL93DRAFT_2170005 [Clavulina sp. PMI_390]|nr:hypothetical protein DL93DRAFT_2170005 [Clavulina sp. PMI_390]
MAWALLGPSDYTTGATGSPPGIPNAGTEVELSRMASDNIEDGLTVGPSPPSPLPAIPSASSRISAPCCPAPGSNVGSSTSSNEACAHARMAALCVDLPRTTKKANQIETGRAWENIRQHAGFEECDIDELCNELSAKARCDGSRPVLEEASFDSIVRGLGDVHRKKSMGVGMGAAGGGGVPVPAPSI